MDNKNNNRDNVTYYFFNKNLKVTSKTVESKTLDEELEDLMNQELSYGDSNYY